MLPETVEDGGYSKLEFGSEIGRGDEEMDTALLRASLFTDFWLLFSRLVSFFLSSQLHLLLYPQ